MVRRAWETRRGRKSGVNRRCGVKRRCRKIRGRWYPRGCRRNRRRARQLADAQRVLRITGVEISRARIAAAPEPEISRAPHGPEGARASARIGQQGGTARAEDILEPQRSPGRVERLKRRARGRRDGHLLRVGDVGRVAVGALLAVVRIGLAVGGVIVVGCRPQGGPGGSWLRLEVVLVEGVDVGVVAPVQS